MSTTFLIFYYLSSLVILIIDGNNKNHKLPTLLETYIATDIAIAVEIHAIEYAI